MGHDRVNGRGRWYKTPRVKAKSEQETCLYGYLPSGFFRKITKATDEYRLTSKPKLVIR
jgi:hypothetical protein